MDNNYSNEFIERILLESKERLKYLNNEYDNANDSEDKSYWKYRLDIINEKIERWELINNKIKGVV